MFASAGSFDERSPFAPLSDIFILASREISGNHFVAFLLISRLLCFVAMAKLIIAVTVYGSSVLPQLSMNMASYEGAWLGEKQSEVFFLCPFPRRAGEDASFWLSLFS